MINRNRILLIAFAIFLPLLLWSGYQIRQAHYPVNRPPSERWEPFVNSLDAEREQFFVDSDGVLLEAELFVPRNGRSTKPAIVFSPGSGDSLYQNYSPDMIETAILDLFLQRDMAVLLVNKRGMGASEGNWTKNDFQGRADDLYAAIAVLHDHPAIDPAQIGIVGHSQGGWIAPLAAAQHPDIAFFVSLAGPTTTVAKNMEDNRTHAFRCDGYSEAEVEARVTKSMRTTRLGARFGEKVPFGMFGFDASIIDYDPTAPLQTVSSPGLLVYAENDRLVTPGWSLTRLEQIFNNNIPEHISTVTIDDGNHGFLYVETPCLPPDEETVLPELLATMNDWLTEQGY